MKQSLRSLIVLSACIIALAIPNTEFAQSRKAPVPKPPPPPLEEPHPAVRDALRALERARNELVDDKNGFGGHQAQALEAIDKTVQEFKAGLENDKY